MVDIADLIADLNAESADADRLVADLPAAEWARPTPAAGWTVAHQVAHLASTDHAAILAISDAEAFNELLNRAAENPSGFVDLAAAEFLDEPGPLLARWRTGRTALAEAISTIPDGTKVAWYGTQMSAASMATARIMETWAHGLDIAEALGVEREPTARLRHIVHLGYRTLPWAFMVHDQAPPSDPVRLELTAPDGALWTFGAAEAENRITGAALDFCRLVTQRGNRADLDLQAVGPVADAFLDVAQAFAGPPGAGREPTASAAL